MSDVLFPISFEKCVVTPSDRTILDAMESGGSASARRMWPANYFMRTIDIDTAKLTLQEWRYLRSFYNQRGTWDTFWFRDNPGRTGNYQVRFAKPLQQTRDAAMFQGSLQLLEVLPYRALPEWDEVQAAAGFYPIAWFDANRTKYGFNTGQLFQDSFLYDAAFESYPANDGNNTLNLGNVFSYAQWFSFVGSADQHFLSANNVAEFIGSHPGATIFMFVRTPAANGDQQVLVSAGQDGTNKGIGLQYDPSGYYKPWIGSAGTWTNAKYLNATPNTWRSVAVSWNGSPDACSLIVNGALVGTDTNARAYGGGPLMVGATPGGNLSAEQGDIANVLFFNAALSAAQCKAVHNLFAYQFGLAQVP